LQDEQLVAYIQDLFTAGTETTATSLYWAIAVLLNFPNYKKVISEEIDNGVGKLLKMETVAAPCLFVLPVLCLTLPAPDVIASGKFKLFFGKTEQSQSLFQWFLNLFATRLP